MNSILLENSLTPTTTPWSRPSITEHQVLLVTDIHPRANAQGQDTPLPDWYHSRDRLFRSIIHRSVNAALYTTEMPVQRSKEYLNDCDKVSPTPRKEEEERSQLCTKLALILNWTCTRLVWQPQQLTSTADRLYRSAILSSMTHFLQSIAMKIKLILALVTEQQPGPFNNTEQWDSLF